MLVGTVALGTQVEPAKTLSKGLANIELTMSHSREKKEGASVSTKKYDISPHTHIHKKIKIKINQQNDCLPFFPLRPNLLPTLEPGSPSSYRAVSTSA